MGIESFISSTGVGTQPLYPEGMAFRQVNDDARTLMANVRDWYNDAFWIEYGSGSGTPAVAYLSTSSVRIASVDVSTVYHVGRPVRIRGTLTGTIYGYVSSVAYTGGNTDVTLTALTGTLVSETIRVWIGLVPANVVSVPALRGNKLYFNSALDNYWFSSSEDEMALVVNGKRTLTVNEGDFTVESDDTGSSEGPAIVMKRDSASPAANDSLGVLYWVGKDSNLNDTTYVKWSGRIVTETDSSESGRMYFYAMRSGSQSLYGYMDGNAFGYGLDKGDTDDGATVGVELQRDGQTYVTASEQEALVVRRNTSVGRLVNLKYGTTVVGAMDVETTTLAITTNKVSKAQNGYSRGLDGVYYQWGTATSSSSADTTITFPIAFPTACRSFTGTTVSTSVTQRVVQLNAAPSTTEAVVRVVNNGGSRVTDTFQWFAVGY